MDNLKKKISSIKNYNIILDIINYINVNNIQYTKHRTGLFIDYDKFNEKDINNIYNILNNNEIKNKSNNLSECENLNLLNYDINLYVRNIEHDTIINKTKLNKLCINSKYSEIYQNLIKIMNNK